MSEITDLTKVNEITDLTKVKEDFDWLLFGFFSRVATDANCEIPFDSLKKMRPHVISLFNRLKNMEIIWSINLKDLFKDENADE